MHFIDIDMKRTENIQVKLQVLQGTIKSLRPAIGSLNADVMLSKIDEILTDVKELEKIQNYTDCAKVEPKKDMVSHPSHYQGKKLECIEAMLDVFGKEKVSAFCELNAFKYVWRSDSKGTDIQDKEKAIWYLDKYNELNRESNESRLDD